MVKRMHHTAFDIGDIPNPVGLASRDDGVCFPALDMTVELVTLFNAPFVG